MHWCFWKILLVIVLQEKHFIFNQGIVLTTCQPVDKLEEGNNENFNLETSKEEENDDVLNINEIDDKEDLVSLIDEFNQEDRLLDQYKKEYKSNIETNLANSVENVQQENKTFEIGLLNSMNELAQQERYLSRNKKSVNNSQESNNSNKPTIRVYELDPSQLTEQTLREVTGLTKQESIPHCSKSYYEAIERWENTPTVYRQNHHHEKCQDDPKANCAKLFQELKQSPLSSISKNYLPISSNEANKKAEFVLLQKKDSPSMCFRTNIVPGQESAKLLKEFTKEKRSLLNMNQTNAIPTEAENSIHSKTSELTNGNRGDKDEILNDFGFRMKRDANHSNLNTINRKYNVSYLNVTSNYEVLISKDISKNILRNVILVKNENIPEPCIQLISNVPLSISQITVANNNTRLNEFSGSSDSKNVVCRQLETSAESKTEKAPLGYLYLQNVSLTDPKFTQKLEAIRNIVSLNGSAIDDDTITIMINPKTLQNKILHAEFMKKMEERKSPDTLVIDLTPVKPSSTNITSKSLENQLAKTSGKTNIRERRDSDDYEDFFESNPPYEELVKMPNNGVLQATNKGADPQAKPWPGKIVIIEDKKTKQTNRECKENDHKCSASPDYVTAFTDPTEVGLMCLSTTPSLKHFREINEDCIKGNNPGLKLFPNNEIAKNQIPDLVKFGILPTLNQKEQKRDVFSKGKLDSPIIIMFPPDSLEENGREGMQFSSSLNDDTKSELTVVDKLANKKVENKILEGFINSIISNYSKQIMTDSTKEPQSGESKSSGDSNLYLFNPSDDQSFQPDGNALSLTPVLIPKETIAKFKDSDAYTKFGPFSEDLIKAILNEDSLKVVKAEIKR